MADFTTMVLNFDGSEMPDELSGGGHALTVGRAIAHALTKEAPGGVAVDADEKIKRAKIAIRLHDAKAAVMDTAETELVKELVTQLYNPMVVHRVFPLIDAATAPTKGKR